MFPSRSLVFGVAAAITLTSASLVASSPPPSVSSRAAPDRDYRLFVGLNVEVSQNEHYALIEGYNNNRVRTDLSPDLISLRHMDDMRFTYRPKLSREPLTIANVQTAKIASTAGAAVDALRNQVALMDFRTEQMAALEADLRSASFGQVDDSGQPIIEADADAIGAATDALSDFDSLTSKITNETDATDQLKRPPAKARSALSITAKISSPRKITDAYIIGMARISTPESVGQDVLFFTQVKRLDPEPRLVQIVKEGLPQEFEVLDITMHVYRNGQELVTNQSAKQFALTRQEALEYLALEHRSDHRGENLPPAPAWSLAPPALFSGEDPGEYDYPLTLQVDALGQVTSIDENIVAPPRIRALARELIFRPALENGIPVSGTAIVNLKDFFR